MILLRLLSAVAISTLLLPCVSSQGLQANTSQAKSLTNTEGTNNVVYRPPSSNDPPKVLYGRVVRLSSGKLLATCEIYPKTVPYFPIFQSIDSGNIWTKVGQIDDQKNPTWGNRYQPVLYQLPSDFGKWKKGTILAAGNSIPADLSKTQLNLYASTDEGASWTYVSSIASGGRASPTNGENPVWEPFLYLHGDTLICYYSDQRDSKHGQKLVHQTTTDGVNWNGVIEDFASPEYKRRPGMPVIAKLPDGRFIMTFEFGGAPEGNFAVYYKIAKDPLSFATASAAVIKADNGAIPVGSPYVTWTPAGGKQGTIVVSSGTNTPLYLLDGSGTGSWKQVHTNVPTAYSRSLIGMADGVYLAGAGPLKGPSNNLVFSHLAIS